MKARARARVCVCVCEVVRKRSTFSKIQHQDSKATGKVEVFHIQEKV
jgi:hypothetical protein